MTFKIEKLFLLLLLFLISCSTNAETEVAIDETTTTVAPTTTTTVNLSYLFNDVLNEGSINSNDIVVSNSGEVIIVGGFSGTVDFGTGPLTSSGKIDGFVAKFDKEFNLTWIKTINESGYGLSEYTFVNGVAILNTEYGETIVVAGSVDSPGETFNTRAQFVYQYSLDGELSSYTIVDSSIDHIDREYPADYSYYFKNDLSAITTYDGKYYVSGKQMGCANWAPDQVCNISTSTDILIAGGLFGQDPLHKVFGSPSSNTFADDIAVDSDGNLLLTGRVRDAVQFDSKSVESSDSSDAFVLKLDTNGNVIWVKSFLSPGSDVGYNINVDSNNNIYINSSFTNTVDYGGGLVGEDKARGYSLVKLDKSGNYLWEKSYFYTDGDTVDYSKQIRIIDMHVDSYGNIYVSMYNNIEKYENFPQGSFVVKYDSDGNILSVIENPFEPLNSIMKISGNDDMIVVYNLFGIFKLTS